MLGVRWWRGEALYSVQLQVREFPGKEFGSEKEGSGARDRLLVREVKRVKEFVWERN